MISDKRSVQQIIAYLEHYGIEHVIISPGSRNGPLTYSFSQSEQFRCYSIVDERCAGFFALGMAQQARQAVVLCCTSGTALLNYSPAIAEAYYQRIPLIVISADRPEEFLNCGIGQTIDQKNVFQNFSNSSVHLNGESLSDSEFQYNDEQLAKAFSRLNEPHPGPIHINIPLREPLYDYVPGTRVKINPIPIKRPTEPDLKSVIDQISKSDKILILTGMLAPDHEMESMLSSLASYHHVLVMTETTSNLNGEKFIGTIDRLIFNFEDDEIDAFKPDTVITIGTNIISKKIKQILRNHPPKAHWHIDPSGKFIDTFGCLTQVIRVDPSTFLKKLKISNKKSDYSGYHLNLNGKLKQLHSLFLNDCNYCDLKAIETILNAIPANYMIQMGNSSVVRYIQLFDQRKDLSYFGNRGTSGIDGLTSTAIGAAFISDKPTTLITGDVAFFYDSNALWNEYIPSEFKIIIINNGGGGIFRIIPGPDSTEVLEEFFETHHQLNARNLAEMHDIQYLEAHNLHSLSIGLEELYDSQHPKILEVFTPRLENDLILKSYFKCLKQVLKPELTGEMLSPTRI